MLTAWQKDVMRVVARTVGEQNHMRINMCAAKAAEVPN